MASAATLPNRGRHRVGALPVRAVVYGRRRMGEQLGYATQRDEVPGLIGAPMRAWHEADRIIPVDDLRVDLDRRTVAMTRADRARPPRQDQGSPPR